MDKKMKIEFEFNEYEDSEEIKILMNRTKYYSMLFDISELFYQDLKPRELITKLKIIMMEFEK